MSRSVLLQLARHFIQVVLQTTRTIDKNALLLEHLLINEKIDITVNIYIEDELKGSASSQSATKSLHEDVICNSKKSAFEDKNSTPLTCAEYLNYSKELLLETPDGLISEKDAPLL